jgi:hypothetical protein
MDADLFLMPLSSDLREQRRALTLLSQLLDRTEQRMHDDRPLPPMRWAISATGHLIGSPFDEQVARLAYEAWAAELGVPRMKRHEHTRGGVTYLRAPATVDGVPVTVEAEIHPPIDTSED